jgi:hypothetical protein
MYQTPFHYYNAMEMPSLLCHCPRYMLYTVLNCYKVKAAVLTKSL